MLNPVYDPIVADSIPTQTGKVLGHVCQLMMDDLGSVVSEPGQPAQNTPADFGVQLLQVRFG